MEIDHNPHERRQGYGIYWVTFAVLAALWIGAFSLFEVDLLSACLGAWSGMALAIWGMDVTGNKVPASWSRQTTRR